MKILKKIGIELTDEKEERKEQKFKRPNSAMVKQDNFVRAEKEAFEKYKAENEWDVYEEKPKTSPSSILRVIKKVKTGLLRRAYKAYSDYEKLKNNVRSVSYLFLNTYCFRTYRKQQNLLYSQKSS